MILPENLVISTIRKNLDKEREIFLVGGSVRNILLNKEIKDYDFVILGDVFELAGQVANSIGSKLSLNKRLLTASFRSSFGCADFASARKEYYKYPGALPSVAPAGIREDSKRRDFTINTLLLPLTPFGWGQVRDLQGGQEDLQQGLIRFLHNESFQDDPTRILRALRFKNRFDFRLEEQTQTCLQRDWPVLSRVSPVRRFKEWVLLCEEDNPQRITEDIKDLGGWESFFGPISYDPGVIRIISELTNTQEIYTMRIWYLCLLALLTASPCSLEGITSYWGINKRDRESLGRTLQFLADTDMSSQNKRKVLRTLKTLPIESAYYIYKFILKWNLSWKDFVFDLKGYRLPVSGADLLNLGMEPGHQLGEILGYLEGKYLEGVFTTKEEALRLAKNKIKEERINAL